MNTGLDLVLALLVLTNLALVVTSRLSRAVTVLALQGFLLATLPVLVADAPFSLPAVGFAIVIMVLKCSLIPRMLREAIRRAGVDWESEPFLGFTKSLLLTAAAFVACKILSARLDWPAPVLSELIVPVAFFVVFTGLLLIIVRQKAISQVLGYLQLDSGIFVFGMAYPYQHSLLVEMAILLDVFIAVMVMVVAIRQISKTFEHIDTDKLSALRDFRR